MEKYSAYNRILAERLAEGDGAGAPPGNKNAYKGGPTQTPDNNPEMKAETDAIEAKRASGLEQSKQLGGGEIMETAINASMDAELAAVEKKYNPMVEAENQDNKYKTVEEADKALHDAGIEGSVEGFDENHGGMNAPNEIVGAFSSFNDDYPNANICSGFNVGKELGMTGGGATAAFRPDDKSIGYNPERPQTTLDNRHFKEGFFSVEQSVKSVMDHEMGHAIADKMGVSMNDDMDYVFTDKTLGNMYNEHASKGTDYVSKNLSGYGASSPHEFMAEAWTEYRNSPNPRPIAQEFGSYFDNKLKNG